MCLFWDNTAIVRKQFDRAQAVSCSSLEGLAVEVGQTNLGTTEPELKPGLSLFLCDLAGSVDSQVLGLVCDQGGPRAQEPSSCCQELQSQEGGRRGLSFLTVVGLRAKQGKQGHLSCESALCRAWAYCHRNDRAQWTGQCQVP